MSLDVAQRSDLPNSQHWFVNTSNLAPSSLHQYVESTREPELPFCRCAQLDCALQGQEWRSSPPGIVLALGFIPYTSQPQRGADSKWDVILVSLSQQGRVS